MCAVQRCIPLCVCVCVCVFVHALHFYPALLTYTYRHPRRSMDRGYDSPSLLKKQMNYIWVPKGCSMETVSSHPQAHTNTIQHGLAYMHIIHHSPVTHTQTHTHTTNRPLPTSMLSRPPRHPSKGPLGNDIVRNSSSDKYRPTTLTWSTAMILMKRKRNKWSCF